MSVPAIKIMSVSFKCPRNADITVFRETRWFTEQMFLEVDWQNTYIINLAWRSTANGVSNANTVDTNVVHCTI